MNPFQKHGIRHLSASSLALYRAEPTLWTMQYLSGIKGEIGAAVWRGSAVEAAVDLLLFTDITLADATTAALTRFDLEAEGEISDKIDKERAGIPGFVEQAALQLRPFGRPFAKQQKTELWLESDFEGTQMEVPIIGYYDYVWMHGAGEGLVVDLKTTWARPSSPKTDHSIQVTCYHLATGHLPKICYATPKKGATYEISESERAEWSWALTRSAFALRQALSRSRNRNEVLSLFSPDFDNFRWDDRLKEELHKIYAGGPTRPKFGVKAVELVGA